MTNQELEQALQVLIVFDRGQFSEENKKWLEREVRKGRVQCTWNTQRIPEGAFMYWIVS